MSGQSAMEFLMTYGWAILIMLVVLAVLFYVGVMNPSTVSPNSINLPPGFSAYDYSIDNDGYLILDVGQSVSTFIDVSGLACAKRDISDNPNNVNVRIRSAQHAVVSNGSTIYCEEAVSGEFYKGYLYLWYKQAGSTVLHRVVADISYRVGGEIQTAVTTTPASTATPANTPTPRPTRTPTPL